MAGLADTEAALIKRFELVYARSTMPVMRTIERSVCGCDYGGNSWTTKDQADRLIELLGLTHASRLIDLGAGTGWPGLYLAQESGCSVTLIDLPEVGLQIATDRAHADGIGARTTVCKADASNLPFEHDVFDAISHSDLLCCLAPKRAVLEECRRIIRPTGRMVFTIIRIRPDLTDTQNDRALAYAPEFVEVELDYPSLLKQTGWQTIVVSDLTEEYRRSCARQLKADQDNFAELAELLGMCDAQERLGRWHSKLHAIEDGLYLREQYCCKKYK